MAAVPVTVVHMTYDQRDRVVALLGDLARQDYPMDALSVVILDDGSTDGTADAIGALVREVPYRLITLHREHSAHYLTAQRWNECLAAAPPTGVFVHVDDRTRRAGPRLQPWGERRPSTGRNRCLGAVYLKR